MRIYFFPAGAEIEKTSFTPHNPPPSKFRCQHLMKLYDPGCIDLCRSQVAKVQNMNVET